MPSPWAPHPGWRAGADPSVPLEQLCWLLRAAAHLLADPGEGEAPLPPVPVAAAAGGPGAPGGGARGGGGPPPPPPGPTPPPRWRPP